MTIDISRTTGYLPRLPDYSEPFRIAYFLKNYFHLSSKLISDLSSSSSTSSSSPLSLFVYVQKEAPSPPQNSSQYIRQQQQLREQTENRNSNINNNILAELHLYPHPLENFLTTATTATEKDKEEEEERNFINNKKTQKNSDSKFLQKKEKIEHALETFQINRNSYFVMNLIAENNFLCSLAELLPPQCCSFLRNHCSVVAQFDHDGGGIFLFGQSIISSVERSNLRKGIPRDVKRPLRRFGYPWSSSSSYRHRSNSSASSIKTSYRNSSISNNIDGDGDRRNTFQRTQPTVMKRRRIDQQQEDADEDEKEEELFSHQNNKNNNNKKKKNRISIQLSSKIFISCYRIPKVIPGLSEMTNIFHQMIRRRISVFTPELVEATSNIFSHVFGRTPQTESAATLKENSMTGLVQLLATVSYISGRVNCRGAAIVVANKLLASSSSAAVAASETVVEVVEPAKSVSPFLITKYYLETLLKECSRRCCRLLTEESHPLIDKTFQPQTIQSSSSASEAEIWLFGSVENLQQLLNQIELWIRTGNRGNNNNNKNNNNGISPLCLIQGVQLTKCEWLCKVEQGARHRSARLQQTFAMFWSWFIAFIFPEWIRTSFHVTHSPRQPSLLLFYLKSDWERWIRNCCYQNKNNNFCSDKYYYLNNDKKSTLSLFSQQQKNLQNQKPSTTTPIVVDSNNNNDSHQTKMSTMMMVTRSDIKRRARETPVQNVLVYSSIRLLPDGNKLRPISTIRGATPKSLSRFVAKIPHEYHFLKQQEQQQQNRNNNNVNVNNNNCSNYYRNDYYNNNSNNNNNNRNNSLISSPNRTILRTALLCLYAGSREQRLGTINTYSSPDVVTVSKTTHTEEYAELIPFVRSVVHMMKNNNYNQEEKEEQKDDAKTTQKRRRTTATTKKNRILHFVKADASRCFDMLDQKLIHDVILKLVPHSQYRILVFDAVVPMKTIPSSCLISLEDFPLVGCRKWIRACSCQSFSKGRISGGIPGGFIIEDSPSSSSSQKNNNNNTSPLFESTSSTFSNSSSTSTKKNHYYNKQSSINSQQQQQQQIVDGEWVRRVLFHHTQNHLRVLNGRMYSQDSFGISQGSTVSSVLTDVCLSGVDDQISEILESFQEKASSLTLRRMDDLIVLSTSAVATKTCCERIIEGWPEIGFCCNKKKLVVSSFCETPETENDKSNDSVNVNDNDDENGGEKSSQQEEEEEEKESTTTAVSDDVTAAPWCGILLHTTDLINHPLECSIDWSRFDIYKLAASFLTKPASGEKSGIMMGFFRVIRSIQMRFPVSIVCTTLNSRQRIQQNLLETFTALAMTLCEMINLSLCSLRPSPRIFFRSRSVAASSLRHHCQVLLSPITQTHSSNIPEDIENMCNKASLIAFSNVLTKWRNEERGSFSNNNTNNNNDSTSLLKNASRIASVVFFKMAMKIEI